MGILKTMMMCGLLSSTALGTTHGVIKTGTSIHYNLTKGPALSQSAKDTLNSIFDRHERMIESAFEKRDEEKQSGRTDDYYLANDYLRLRIAKADRYLANSLVNSGVLQSEFPAAVLAYMDIEAKKRTKSSKRAKKKSAKGLGALLSLAWAAIEKWNTLDKFVESVQELYDNVVDNKEDNLEAKERMLDQGLNQMPPDWTCSVKLKCPAIHATCVLDEDEKIDYCLPPASGQTMCYPDPASTCF